MKIPTKEIINANIEVQLQGILELIPNLNKNKIEIVQTNLRLVYLGAWISAQGELAKEYLGKESLKKVGK